MSIRKRGNSYEVRYRTSDGRQPAKTFRTKGAAEKFERERRNKKEMGVEARVGMEMRLDAFVNNEWWPQHRHLQPRGISFYQYLLERHILPWLGRNTLGELTTSRIARFRTQMENDGAGVSAVIRALALLSQILDDAVRFDYIPRNNARNVRRPKPPTARAIHVYPVEVIESVRMRLGLRDATLVSVLAYAGLRPSEALALTWGDVHNNSIVIDKALSAGKVKSTKTNTNRSVPILSPLRYDLDNWYAARWDDKLVFPSHAGRPWTKTTFDNWRKRVLQTKLQEMGLEGIVYELRHTFVSLRINEGADVAEVAEEAGHSPEVCLRKYIHVFKDYKGAQPTSAETRIWGVRKKCALGKVSQLSQNGDSPSGSEWSLPDSNR